MDHLAVAGQNLDETAGFVEDRLGVRMGPGGEHAHFGTHNRLLGLADGLYLEAISINPEAAGAATPRWFDLDRLSGPPHLRNWICRVDDLDGALAEAPGGAGVPVQLQRGDLRWRMAVPDTGVLPFDNLFPALIQWQVAELPGERLPPSGCALVALEVRHPDAAALADSLPLADGRVSFVTGTPGLVAEIRTPHGNRLL
nr:VOC family protein [Shimia biformata]